MNDFCFLNFQIYNFRCHCLSYYTLALPCIPFSIINFTVFYCILNGIARFNDILMEGNRLNLMTMAKVGPNGALIGEIIEAVPYRTGNTDEATAHILVILKELLNRARMNRDNVVIVIKDNGRDSNPSHHEIRALQPNLNSTSSACHDLACVLTTIGRLSILTFNGVIVNLTDLKRALQVNIDPETVAILNRFWAQIKSLYKKETACHQLNFFSSIELITSMELVFNNQWLAANHQIQHDALRLVIASSPRTSSNSNGKSNGC